MAVVAEVDASAAVARAVDAGLLHARAERLVELAALGRWLDRQLRTRTGSARPPDTLMSAAPRPPNEVHRLSGVEGGEPPAQFQQFTV